MSAPHICNGCRHCATEPAQIAKRKGMQWAQYCRHPAAAELCSDPDAPITTRVTVCAGYKKAGAAKIEILRG